MSDSPVARVGDPGDRGTCEGGQGRLQADPIQSVREVDMQKCRDAARQFVQKSLDTGVAA